MKRRARRKIINKTSSFDCISECQVSSSYMISWHYDLRNDCDLFSRTYIETGDNIRAIIISLSVQDKRERDRDRKGKEQARKC
jgi:hypothetical protein